MKRKIKWLNLFVAVLACSGVAFASWVIVNVVSDWNKVGVTSGFADDIPLKIIQDFTGTLEELHAEVDIEVYESDALILRNDNGVTKGVKFAPTTNITDVDTDSCDNTGDISTKYYIERESGFKQEIADDDEFGFCEPNEIVMLTVEYTTASLACPQFMDTQIEFDLSGTEFYYELENIPSPPDYCCGSNDMSLCVYPPTYTRDCTEGVITDAIPTANETGIVSLCYNPAYLSVQRTDTEMYADAATAIQTANKKIQGVSMQASNTNESDYFAMDITGSIGIGFEADFSGETFYGELNVRHWPDYSGDAGTYSDFVMDSSNSTLPLIKASTVNMFMIQHAGGDWIGTDYSVVVN